MTVRSVEEDRVLKIDNKLDQAWREKFEKILEHMDIPAFIGFVDGGYQTKYIDGIDLQEDLPFQPRHDKVRSFPLTKLQRERVIKIFRDIVKSGIETNYILADFTKRNIILKEDIPYLIDYDVIIEGELSQDYIDLWQKMLDYLEIDYRFDGGLKKLYECLG